MPDSSTPVGAALARRARHRRARRAAARRDRAGAALSAGGPVLLRAFARPLAEVKVLIVGQDPYPTPGTRSACRSPSTRTCGPAAEPGRTSTGARRRPRHPAGAPRRPLGVERPGRHAAQPRADGRPRRSRIAPRMGMGEGDRARDPHARRARSPLVAILWGRDAANLRPFSATPIIESAHPRRCRRAAASSARGRSRASTRCWSSRARRRSTGA
jgi:uracil-DNA glycosylase